MREQTRFQRKFYRMGIKKINWIKGCQPPYAKHQMIRRHLIIFSGVEIGLGMWWLFDHHAAA